MIILDSIIEGADSFPQADRERFICAVIDYIRGEEPELDGYLAGVFAMVRPVLDNSRASRENGAKGGRPRGRRAADAASSQVDGGAEASAETQAEPSDNPGHNPGETQAEPSGNPDHNPVETQSESQTEPRANLNMNRKRKKEESPSDEGRKKPARFVPPTAAQVADYDRLWCARKGRAPAPPDEHERFTAYYDSVGWKVGKARTPMKDWTGAWRNWALRRGGGEVSQGGFDFSAYGA